MKTYWSDIGFLHDKPVKEDGKPSDNNGWIHTAYWAKRFKKDRQKLQDYYSPLLKKCKNNHEYFNIPKRLPWLLEPPISRDEIFGKYYLCDQEAENQLQIIANGGLFSKDLPPLKIKDIIDVAWDYYTNRDRNYFWKNKKTGFYRISLKLWPWDLYVLKKWLCYETKFYEKPMFNIYAWLTSKFGKNYEKNVLWLQDSSKATFKEIEFEFGHPLNLLK